VRVQHLFKREPQSAYWMQIQSGMYVLVASFHVEDCENISAEEKAKLIKMFDENDLPHIVTETHVVISPDTQHGFAMVQHFHQEIFIKYLKKNMPSITRCFCRSDGCRSQYKGRHHFGFISSHGIAEGITTTWSWFCSCHGKCLCDPEGGTCKNAALRFETNSEGGGKLTSSWDFYAFCKANLETTSKDLFTKKGRGIYRRHFYYVPASGEGAVNYNIPKWSALQGSNQIHQMRGGILPGYLSYRLRSCHCVVCYNEGRVEGPCSNSHLHGFQWEHTEIRLEAVGSKPTLRKDRENRAKKEALQLQVGEKCAFLVNSDEAWMIGECLPPLEGALRWGQDAAVMCVGANGEESKVVQEVQVEVAYSDDEVSSGVCVSSGLVTNWMGRLERGDPVIYVQKFEPKATRGSNRGGYIRTNKFFGCFSGDLRHSGFNMVEKQSVAAATRRSSRSHASSVRADADPHEDIVLILTQDDKDTILSQLATSG